MNSRNILAFFAGVSVAIGIVTCVGYNAHKHKAVAPVTQPATPENSTNGGPSYGNTPLADKPPVVQTSDEQNDNPALYVCKNNTTGLFLIISPAGGEFMLFDKGGAWLNNGQFTVAETDNGTKFLAAVVGQGSLGLVKAPNGVWHLVVNSNNKTTDLICQ